MLQNKLFYIKGQLLEMMFEMYRDMNTDEKGVDYQEFFLEFAPVLKEIQKISDLNELEVFCESYGLNDEITNPMSFPALVKQAYES